MLKIRLKENILFIELDNQENGQSFGPEEADQLLKILKDKNFTALVWSAPSDRAPWCSGGNLKYYAKNRTRQQGVLANRKIRKALEMLKKHPVPTVALVDGDCFGGGVELLSCFDRVISAPHCLYGLWQRRIGLIFGWGGGANLLERMSSRKLVDLSLSTRTLSAYEALQVGLVDQIARRGSLESQALRWLAAMAVLPEAPVMALKNWSAKSETSIFERLWWNPEHKRALKKFSAGKAVSP